MSDSGLGDVGYFWCLRHSRVETLADACPMQYRIGPFRSSSDAENALDTVERRNAAWDAEDARWNGEDQ